MARVSVVLPLLFLSGLGCAGTVGDGEPAVLARYELVADDDGALRDVGRDDSPGYPNPRRLDRMTVSLRADGRLCALSDDATFCGGPANGIPYLARARIVDGLFCVQAVDLYGNEVGEEHCPEGTVVGTGEFAVEPFCRDAVAEGGRPCSICTDERGTVTENSCAPGGGEALDCGSPEALGAQLLVNAFNS